MIELKYKKIDDKTSVLHDALTDDPVAHVIKVGKNDIAAAWHPAMRAMYPHIDQNLSLSRPPTRNNMDNTRYAIQSAYETVQNETLKDPLKARYIGEIEKSYRGEYGGTDTKKFKQYSLHDENDKHVATLNIGSDVAHATQAFEPSAQEFSAYSPEGRYARAHIDWVGESPTPEQHQMLVAKHSSIHPVSLMSRVKYFNDIKSREPSFVGLTHSDNVRMYKTNLKPEDAAKKYVEHMKSSKELAGYTINQVSPHHIIAHKPYDETSNSGSFTHHTVDTSTPGIVRHFKYDYKGPGHYASKPLSHVIE